MWYISGAVYNVENLHTRHEKPTFFSQFLVINQFPMSEVVEYRAKVCGISVDHVGACFILHKDSVFVRIYSWIYSYITVLSHYTRDCEKEKVHLESNERKCVYNYIATGHFQDGRYHCFVWMRVCSLQ